MTINGGFALNGNQSFQNLAGTSLEMCSNAPLTGYFRNGYCATCPDDYGLHTVCAQMTQEFLDFSLSKGNNLITPHPPTFPGLKEGDKWCLCASRWFEAFQVGKAPNIFARATNLANLQQEQITNLLSKAIDMA
ncbi:unnamed protein product [Adineta steineri]|uniref:DUF2237 domain-containing protein n=1 Tax=Adineta steineri TaxID=433720 RepID=A0A819KQT4_9BILA|nr:unnamed protein product [Adineta steineri]